jgi:hypothetical protein
MTWISEYFQKVRARFKRSGPKYVAARLTEMPESLVTGRVFLVGNGKPWAAAFLCPCGCGDAIRLNLLPEARPSWNVMVHKDNTVSISPSIRRDVGCHSHFWIERGYVVHAIDRRGRRDRG